MKIFVVIMSLGGVLTCLALISQFWAIDPTDLKEEIVAPPLATVIQVPESQQPEPEKSVVEAATPDTSLMASLAPDNLSNTELDFGSGISFGSGGSGPAIGGSGGFGGNSHELVAGAAAVHRPPRVRNKAPLDYPPEARRKSVSGHVILKIEVDEQGRVGHVLVEDAKPKGFFEQAAQNSVKKWIFEPALINGKIARAWTLQKINFGLN